MNLLYWCLHWSYWLTILGCKWSTPWVAELRLHISLAPLLLELSSTRTCFLANFCSEEHFVKHNCSKPCAHRIRWSLPTNSGSVSSFMIKIQERPLMSISKADIISTDHECLNFWWPHDLSPSVSHCLVVATLLVGIAFLWLFPWLLLPCGGNFLGRNRLVTSFPASSTCWDTFSNMENRRTYKPPLPREAYSALIFFVELHPIATTIIWLSL